MARKIMMKSTPSNAYEEFEKLVATTTLVLPTQECNCENKNPTNPDEIPPIITDGDKQPDNPSGVTIFIPTADRIGVPPNEFEVGGTKFQIDNAPLWDFKHQEYKIYPKFKLKVDDSFKVYNKTLKIKQFVTIPDELGQNVDYIIYTDGSKMLILPEILFYAQYNNAIVESFSKEPNVTFPQSRIEVTYQEDRIYPLPFESDGILVDITAANTSGHYVQDMNNPDKIVLTPQDSIEFYTKNDKLYFKALKPELNVVTLKFVDVSYSKTKLATIVIKVNRESEF